MSKSTKMALRLDKAVSEAAKLKRDNQHLQSIIEMLDHAASVNQFRAAVERAQKAEARNRLLEEMLEHYRISVPA